MDFLTGTTLTLRIMLTTLTLRHHAHRPERATCLAWARRQAQGASGGNQHRLMPHDTGLTENLTLQQALQRPTVGTLKHLRPKVGRLTHHRPPPICTHGVHARCCGRTPAPVHATTGATAIINRSAG